MPFAAQLEDRLLRCLARGRREQDFAALALDQREGAGLD
jgi:hypothetical protein